MNPKQTLPQHRGFLSVNGKAHAASMFHQGKKNTIKQTTVKDSDEVYQNYTHSNLNCNLVPEDKNPKLKTNKALY